MLWPIAADTSRAEDRQMATPGQPTSGLFHWTVEHDPDGKSLGEAREPMRTMRRGKKKVAGPDRRHPVLHAIMAGSGGDDIERVTLVWNLRPVRGPRRKPDLQITIDEGFGRTARFPRQVPCGGKRNRCWRLVHVQPSSLQQPISLVRRLLVQKSEHAVAALALEITERAGAGGDQVVLLVVDFGLGGESALTGRRPPGPENRHHGAVARRLDELRGEGQRDAQPPGCRSVVEGAGKAARRIEQRHQYAPVPHALGIPALRPDFL